MRTPSRLLPWSKARFKLDPALIVAEDDKALVKADSAAA
jgi:hypothetical protein